MPDLQQMPACQLFDHRVIYHDAETYLEPITSSSFFSSSAGIWFHNAPAAGKTRPVGVLISLNRTAPSTNEQILPAASRLYRTEVSGEHHHRITNRVYIVLLFRLWQNWQTVTEADFLVVASRSSRPFLTLIKFSPSPKYRQYSGFLNLLTSVMA